jgi:cell division protein FtsI/penicillin-binding protein 2
MISRRTMLAALVPTVPVTVALRVRDGALLRCSDQTRARRLLAAPGSTVKPLTLLAMKLRGPLHCGRKLEISGHHLDCSHAPLAGQVDAETALAASCNCWFATRARTMDAALLHQALLRSAAEARLAHSEDELVLQALGVEGVRFAPMTLAQAYLGLATSSDAAVRRGMERAVLEGTAQLAALEGMSIAGKTGTSKEGAWFAGFAPAANPQVVVTAYVAGGRGGADAAPAAREIFEWWRHSAQSRY